MRGRAATIKPQWEWSTILRIDLQLHESRFIDRQRQTPKRFHTPGQIPSDTALVLRSQPPSPLRDWRTTTSAPWRKLQIELSRRFLSPTSA